MLKEVKINIPNVEDFYKFLEKYDNLKMNTFSEYYTHAITEEKRDATLLECSKTFESERKYWRGPSKEYQTIEHARFGTDISDGYDVAIKNITHSYKKSIVKDGVLYGIIEIMNTPNGRKYQNDDTITLTPIITHRTSFNEPRITFMKITK